MTKKKLLKVDRSQSFWKSKEAQRSFFEKIAQQWKFKNFEDWYNISVSQITKVGGSGVLSFYRGSHIKALMSTFPEVPWKPWKFKHTHQGFWKEIIHQRTFFDSVGKDLGIKKLDDWYSVTIEQIESQGGGGLIREYYQNSILVALMTVYPEHYWTREMRLAVITNSSISRNQLHVFNQVKEIFPFAKDIFYEYYYESSDGNFELDVFIPSIQLAFEYQGKQHYADIPIKHSASYPLKRRMLNDSLKQSICKSHNITLIEIPYWWDGSLDSLKATIHQFRPELVKLPENANPIPKTKQVVNK